jgi:hypothetical protein
VPTFRGCAVELIEPHRELFGQAMIPNLLSGRSLRPPLGLTVNRSGMEVEAAAIVSLTPRPSP